MNFVSMKKSYLAFLTASIVCTQCVMADSEKSQFKNDELVYIHQLATEIENMFEVFKNNVARFIDAKDHTPYKKLVYEMCGKLDEFEEQVVTTLYKKLNEEKTKNSVTYYKSLTIVHSVLTEFITRVTILKRILLKSEYINTKPNQVGKNGLQLGKELEKYFHDLISSKMIEQLEDKIDEVYNLISDAGDKDLADRLKTIKGILAKALKHSSVKKSGNNSAVSIVNGISAKMRHNQ